MGSNNARPALRRVFGVLAVPVAVAMATAVAVAGGPNYATTWQENFGLRVFGHVQIQASYNDGGYHAASGYHRFMRDKGPSLDTGRLWVTATSPYDTVVRARTDWVYDSLGAGPEYDTRYYYGFFYYGGGGTCSAGKSTPAMTC